MIHSMNWTFPARSNLSLRFVLLFALAWIVLAGGCARMPGTGLTSISASNLNDLRGYLLNHKADVDQFRLRGPFSVSVEQDHDLQLSATERIRADLFLSSPAEKAPLVILLHGYENSKESHAYQAMHLATWGMHSLVVQLPNKGPWVGNGRTLARIVESIRRRPEALDSRIDVNRIILAGHSFGGTAAAIALAEGASAAGGILLDPAGIGKELSNFLKRLNKPLILVGSDQQVTKVRDHGLFYELVRSDIIEISIRDAHHEDAQFPMEPPPKGSGSNSSATEELQITFVSALTSAAFSLGFTGKFDYAWSSFDDAIRTGKMFDRLRK